MEEGKSSRLSSTREGTNPPLKRGLILTPESIFGKVSLVFSWFCPQSLVEQGLGPAEYLVEQGLGPAEYLPAKLQTVYLLSFSGSLTAPSFLLLLSETWKGKQSALVWIGGNVLFDPKGRIPLPPCFIGKNVERCNFNFARTHSGRETGERKADVKRCLSAVSPGLRLVAAARCCTGQGRCAVSPVPAQPFQRLRCAGDTPSGCGQSFCSRVRLGSLALVCVKHILLAWPQRPQWLYDCAVLIAVYHSPTSVSPTSSVGDDFTLKDGKMSVLGGWD